MTCNNDNYNSNDNDDGGHTIGIYLWCQIVFGNFIDYGKYIMFLLSMFTESPAEAYM